MNRSRKSDAVGGMAEDPPMPVRVSPSRQPWNKGLLVGQKKPLEPKHAWSIRVRLEIAGSKRDLAIFNLAIDSKLRACDLVKLRLDDICSGGRVRDRATVVQKKTGRPVQFGITEQTRNAIETWKSEPRLRGALPGSRAPRRPCNVRDEDDAVALCLEDPFAAGYTARCRIGQSSLQSSLIVCGRHSKKYVMEDPCHRSSSPRAAAPPP